MKLEDLGVKVKKIRKEKAKFDTGGKEAAKIRAKRWKEIEREEKLEEIRQRRLLEYLKKQEEQQRIEEEKKRWEDAYQIWLKIDYLMKYCMDETAYKYLDSKKLENPELYKALLRCIVEPHVIKNIDRYVEHVYKKGGPKDKIKVKTLLHFEEYLTGKKRETKIEVEEDGVRRKL